MNWNEYLESAPASRSATLIDSVVEQLQPEMSELLAVMRGEGLFRTLKPLKAHLDALASIGDQAASLDDLDEVVSDAFRTAVATYRAPVRTTSVDQNRALLRNRCLTAVTTAVRTRVDRPVAVATSKTDLVDPARDVDPDEDLAAKEQRVEALFEVARADAAAGWASGRRWGREVLIAATGNEEAVDGYRELISSPSTALDRSDDDPDLDELVIEAETIAKIKQIIEISLRPPAGTTAPPLTEAEAIAINMFYGFDGPVAETEEVATALGVTDARARNIRARGVEKLRQLLLVRTSKTSQMAKRTKSVEDSYGVVPPEYNTMFGIVRYANGASQIPTHRRISLRDDLASSLAGFAHSRRWDEFCEDNPALVSEIADARERLEFTRPMVLSRRVTEGLAHLQRARRRMTKARDNFKTAADMVGQPTTKTSAHRANLMGAMAVLREDIPAMYGLFTDAVRNIGTAPSPVMSAIRANPELQIVIDRASPKFTEALRPRHVVEDVPDLTSVMELA